MSIERRRVSWEERDDKPAEGKNRRMEERRDEIRLGWWLVAVAASSGLWVLIGLALLRL